MKKRILSAILSVFLVLSAVFCLYIYRMEFSSQAAENFEIHFIDVGQADAALIICEGSTMLIDGGNVADSAAIYTHLKKQGVTHLNYLIATHAHEDHIGGLPGALNYATVDTVYCPVTSYSTNAFSDFAKYVNNRGATITVPEVGDSFMLGSAEVLILACNSADGTNNTSIVLKITYGDTTFLFTGDAEREAEAAILDSGFDLKSTVLKVGHHGSASSTSYPFLREVMPKYAVISVGTDNDYGHPTDAVLSRLDDADVTVFRTDLLGTIVCVSDGKNVIFEGYKNEPADDKDDSQSDIEAPNTESVTAVGEEYVLNTNSKKFHYPSCTYAERISEENKDTFVGTRDQLIDSGYDPCGVCKP